MHTDDPQVIAAAQRLWEAELNKTVCQPVRDLIGYTDVEKAYAVQNIIQQKRLAEGARVIGSKIGLTSPDVQQQLGVDRPDYGSLYDDREVQNGGEISVSEIMQPKAEAEIAFVLGRDLDTHGLTTVDIISAIDYALIAIEIVGSRIENWDIKITDTIADNASASHWVVGHQPVPLSKLDLINCGMQMTNHGTVVSEGQGKNCLGSPINATLWLARQLVVLGQPMRAGDLVLTGSLGPMVNIESGDHFVARVSGMGEVSVHFTK